MRLSKILTAAASLSLVAAPIAAQASNTSPTRSASKADSDEIAGISPLILILVAAAIVAVVVIVADDKNEPASP